MLSFCVCLFVCPSDTRQYCTKTAKRRITQITSYDSPDTLVFPRQRYLRNSNGLPPTLIFLTTVQLLTSFQLTYRVARSLRAELFVEFHNYVEVNFCLKTFNIRKINITLLPTQKGIRFSPRRLYVYLHNVSKADAARITKLTSKCSTMRPGNPIIVVVKMSRSRVTETLLALVFALFYSCRCRSVIIVFNTIAVVNVNFFKLFS